MGGRGFENNVTSDQILYRLRTRVDSESFGGGCNFKLG